MKHINTLCGQNGGFLGVFTKLRKATHNFVDSNLVFKHFSKICRQNSGFIKI
jgi:hypothetical protein